MTKLSSEQLLKADWKFLLNFQEEYNNNMSNVASKTGHMTTITKPTDIKPPFDEEKAKSKVKAAENAWNTCNPELVARFEYEWRDASNPERVLPNGCVPMETSIGSLKIAG